MPAGADRRPLWLSSRTLFASVLHLERLERVDAVGPRPASWLTGPAGPANCIVGRAGQHRRRRRDPAHERRGSAGRIVATPFSSTSTTYLPGSSPPLKRRSPFGRRAMIACVSVRVSTAKPSPTRSARNASSPTFRVPSGSMSPAIESEYPTAPGGTRHALARNVDERRASGVAQHVRWTGGREPLGSGGTVLASLVVHRAGGCRSSPPPGAARAPRRRSSWLGRASRRGSRRGQHRVGWTALIVFPQIVGGIGSTSSALLLAGGIAYSAGAVVSVR